MSKPDAEAQQTVVLRRSFDGVVLVCRDCEKRGNGPKRLKSKTMRTALKHATRRVPTKLRVVASSCLGPCLKKRMTVAIVTAGQPVAFYAVVDAQSAGAIPMPLPISPSASVPSPSVVASTGSERISVPNRRSAVPDVPVLPSERSAPALPSLKPITPLSTSTTPKTLR